MFDTGVISAAVNVISSMRQSTQRSIGARKFLSSSVQDQILSKSDLSSVGVAIQPPPILPSGIPHSVIITSRDDAPRTQKFVISISDKSFHISFKNEQSKFSSSY